MAARVLLACCVGVLARRWGGSCPRKPAQLFGLLQAIPFSALPCSNLVVLDEVMQHLDGEGCLRVAQLLKQASGPGFERAGVWGCACSC